MKLSCHYYFFITLALPGLFLGCKDKQEIKVYRVSKAELESMPQPGMGMGSSGAGPMSGMPGMPGMGMPGMPGAQGGGESGPDLTGTAPSQWEVQPPTAMRQASYLVKGDKGALADVSLVALGGAAGGTLDNVNRWLNQLGQPAMDEAKLKAISQQIPSPVGEVTLVDLEGLPQSADPAKDGRILAAIALSNGRTLFFKMRGNADLVESQKQAFIQWIGTVHPAQSEEKPQTQPPQASQAPMAATGAAPQIPAPPVDAAQGQIQWQTPEGWSSVPASSMRYASFAVSGQNGESGDISVSVFPGETGGDLANVNRWRGQVGLPPISDADLKTVVTKVNAANSELKVIDLAGGKARLLAAWTLNNGNTWFFKLTGPDALVGGEKEKFMKFLQSIQFKH